MFIPAIIAFAFTNIALCVKRLKMGVTRSQAQGFAINNFYDVLKIQSALFISFGNKKYR